jgi:putative sigma-54 modulation protein
MQTQITGRHVDITPALRDYIDQRLGKLQRIFDNIISAHVILGTNNAPAEDKTAEINLDVSQTRLSADDAAPTHEEAVRLCVDHLRRQLKKHKAQLRSYDKDSHR